MNRARQNQFLSPKELKEKERRRQEESKKALQAKGRLCSTLARVARRPLKTSVRFQDLAVVQEVRRMTDNQFRQMMAAAYAVLDKTNKYIFLSNINKIVEEDKDRIFVAVTVKEGIMSAPMAKRALKQQAGKVAARWSRRKKQVFINLTTMTKASNSINSMLDSTAKWGKRHERDSL